ncbi:MAG: helix-turn-helix domain-containing protein [Caldilineaceae bacterium]|nr:helix-turn-helix domain-containing protein [Caldilineaceae bacterium]
MNNSDIQEFSSFNQSGYGSRTNQSTPSNGGGSASSSLQTIGAILRERRESAQVSLAEVEKATRIRQKYLAALEADEWHLLPGEVVGRGFLRNYANFLRLNTNEVMDRRRAMTDGDLARVLSNTSAGASLPAVREIDYRPKDVDLEETPMSERLSEYMSTGRDWFAPIVSLIAIVLVAFLIFWAVREIGDEAGRVLASLQERAAVLMNQNQSGRAITSESGEQTGARLAVNNTPAADANPASSTGSNNAENVSGSGDQGGSVASPVGGTGGADNAAVVIVPTATDTPTPTNTPEPPTPEPTPTETPEPPTPEPLPTNTPEPPTPEPLPTNTPEPPPAPVVVAASCPDARSVISSPGVDQVVSGVVPIIGSATHEAFNFYKLEFAPGANAQGGYGYFDGTSIPIQGGVLGNLNTTGLANGAYTIQLVVVDQSANYPPPCRVTINVQN